MRLFTKHQGRWFSLIMGAMGLIACGSETAQTQGAPDSEPLAVGAEAISRRVDPPLTVHPKLAALVWGDQQVLDLGKTMGNDLFGASVAVSGDTAIVGAPLDEVNGKRTGAAYIFVRSGGKWVQQQQLVASDAAANDGFGSKVAVNGDTAIVGDDIVGKPYPGAAYVFVRQGNTWVQQQKLVAGDGAGNDGFGSSLALGVGTAVVGAAGADISGKADQGAAYVFVRVGNLWIQQQKLVAADGAADDHFGSAASLNGDTAIVGASAVDVGGKTDQGAAYVFVRSGSAWTQQQKLVAGDGVDNDAFGLAVALDVDTAVVGAPGRAGSGSAGSGGAGSGGAGMGSGGGNPAQSGPGVAYVFVRSGSAWTQQQQISNPPSAYAGIFGLAVALSGDTALVGAPSIGSGLQGSVHMFGRAGTQWTEQQWLLAPFAAAGSFFGSSVALSGDKALIGAREDEIDNPTSPGHVYAYTLITPHANGDACAADIDCASGFCVDGVCCDTACGKGTPGDCQACSKAAGAQVDGVCTVLPAGAVCRAASGDCDVTEVCDGQSVSCPENVVVPDGTACGPGPGQCTDGHCNVGLCPGGGGFGGACMGGPAPDDDGGCSAAGAGAGTGDGSAPFALALGLFMAARRRRGQAASSGRVGHHR